MMRAEPDAAPGPIVEHKPPALSAGEAAAPEGGEAKVEE
jgi:hypothetical protein